MCRVIYSSQQALGIEYESRTKHLKYKSISEGSLLHDANSKAYSSPWENKTRSADEAADLKVQYATQKTLPLEFLLASLH